MPDPHRPGAPSPARLDITLLDRPLPVVEYPGLESSEPQLLEIIRLADQGEDLAAGEKAQTLLRAGLFDVRLLSFYFFGALIEQGPPCLPDMARVLIRLLGDNWPAFGPAAKRDRLLDRGLVRLFRSLRDRLVFHKQIRDERWNTWLVQTTPMVISAFRSLTDRLRAGIAERIPDARSLDDLVALDVWLKNELLPMLVTFRTPPTVAAVAVAARAAAEGAAVAEAQTSADVAHTETPAETSDALALDPAVVADEILEEVRQQGYSLALPGCITLLRSPGMDNLVRKLRAFADLVQEQRLNKAAVVADDIRDTLEHFDPRLYLPKLFSAYFRLLAANVDDLAPHLEDRRSPAWQSLQQLYHFDLDAFLEE